MCGSLWVNLLVVVSGCSANPSAVCPPCSGEPRRLASCLSVLPATFRLASNNTCSKCLPAITVQDAPREGPGALRATSAASQQLLWLAEVEHILGTASLQLAFAARNPCPSSAPSTLPNDYTPGAAVPPASVPTVSATSRQAAGGRRVWGYGSGPFAEVSATGPDIFALNGRTDVSEGGRGGATDGSDEDENLIVEKLEVRRSLESNLGRTCVVRLVFEGDYGAVQDTVNGRGGRGPEDMFSIHTSAQNK